MSMMVIDDSKLISTILKRKKLQQISQESMGLILPGSWIRAMNWTRQTVFSLEFHPNKKEIIIHEEVSDTESGPD